MTMRRSLVGIAVIVSCSAWPVTSGNAFHENITPCKAGEVGYLATLLDDNRVYTFLSSQDPPSANSVICNVAPRQLVKTMAMERGM